MLLSCLAAGLMTACASGGKSPQTDAPHFLIGFQLYSVRTDLEKDFYGSLKKVREMGYDGVEFYNEFYGHSPVEVKAICTELGHIPFSNHVPFQTMIDDLDQQKKPILQTSQKVRTQAVTWAAAIEDEISRHGS